jgi:hypothetical protein
MDEVTSGGASFFERLRFFGFAGAWLEADD